MASKQKIYPSLAVAGVALFLASCGEPEQSVNALATVNGEAITQEAFDYWNRDGRVTSLDELIDRSAAVQAARKAGLDQDPSIKAEIESLLIAKLREKEVLSRIESQVTEDEIQSYYADHSQEFTTAASLEVSVLWFDTRGRAPLEARYRPRLEEAQQQFTGPDFGKLSITHSEHRASRFKGGRLGRLEPGSARDAWTMTVLEIAQSIPEGETLSEIVVNDRGSFLVAVSNRQASGQRPLASVRNQIISQIKLARRQFAEEAFQQSLKNSTEVVRYREPKRKNLLTQN